MWLYTNEFSLVVFSSNLSTTLRRNEANSETSMIVGRNERWLRLLPSSSLQLLLPTHTFAGDLQWAWHRASHQEELPSNFTIR